MKKTEKLQKQIKRMLVFFIILLLTNSCKFTDFGGEFDEDGEYGGTVNDFSFVEFGSVLPYESLRASMKYGYYIYAADGYGRLSTFYVSDPNYPYRVSTSSVSSQSIRTIQYDNRYNNLYLAAGSAGFYMLNVNNPSYIADVTSYTNVYALDLSYRNDRLAVIDYNGWKLYQVINTYSLSELNSYSYFMSQQPQKLYMTDYWLYVFSTNTLDIFDVTNPYNIVKERTIDLGGSFVDYTLMDGYLVSITQTNLRIFEIFQPLDTNLAKEYSLRKPPQMLRYNNGYLYISWTDKSLSVYKVYSINNIEEVARKSFSKRIMGIEFQGDYLYLSNEENGLLIYRFIP